MEHLTVEEYLKEKNVNMDISILDLRSDDDGYNTTYYKPNQFRKISKEVRLCEVEDDRIDDGVLELYIRHKL